MFEYVLLDMKTLAAFCVAVVSSAGFAQVGSGYPGYYDWSSGSAGRSSTLYGGANALQSTSPTWRSFKWGDVSAIGSAEQKVLATEAAWQSYWARLSGDPAAAKQAPKGIKWNEEMLIAITLGERRSGGYSVFVEKLEQKDPRNLVVRYVEQTPNPDSMTVQMITRPYVVIRVRRTASAISFAKRTQAAPQLWQRYDFGRDDWGG